MFYLDSALLQKAAAELSGKRRDIPFFSAPTIDDPDLASLLRSLHVSLEAGGTALERQSKFLWTFAQLAKRHADDPSMERAMGDEKTVVRTVRRYIEDHYTENVSLDDLARVGGLSAYHLLRVFRSEIGLPPHAFLEQVRINRARKFLRAGGSIADVTFKTGFSDQSHFSRHFKKMTGVTPGQYQKAARLYKTSLRPAAHHKPH
jgi:AraC-like DNA-binding protein